MMVHKHGNGVVAARPSRSDSEAPNHRFGGHRNKHKNRRKRRRARNNKYNTDISTELLLDRVTVVNDDAETDMVPDVDAHDYSRRRSEEYIPGAGKVL